MWVGSMGKVGLIIVVLITYGVSICCAQDKKWGVFVAPGLSTGKLPSGTTVSYPGPPFYVDLVITEPMQFSFGINTFIRRAAFKSFINEISLGIQTYNYKINFDYNLELSSANNIYNEKKFAFIEGMIAFGKEFHLGSYQVIPKLGFGVDYLIRYRSIFLNIVNGEEFIRDYNELADANRINLNYKIGFSIEKKINEKIAVFLEPSFRHLVQSYEDNLTDPVKPYSFNMAIGLILINTH